MIFFQSLANFPAKGLLAREAPLLGRYACLLGAGVLNRVTNSSPKGPLLKIVIFHFYLQPFLFSSTRILHL